MDTPAIEVRGMTKRFRVVHQRSSLKAAALGLLRPRQHVAAMTALDNITFDVARGETVGIVGSNGSGKSTILLLLAGVYRPTEGEIIVRGRIASLLALGAGFHPELTAEDNAVLGAMIHGLSRRQAVDRLSEIIAFAGIEEFADTKIKHFSNGMQVRLGFSVVVHTEPDVLLVDEVLAVGDERFQRRCLDKMHEFQAAGKTIVVVSHDLESVAQVAPRVIWLDRSHLRADGPSADVLAQYRAANQA